MEFSEYAIPDAVKKIVEDRNYEKNILEKHRLKILELNQIIENKN